MDSLEALLAYIPSDRRDAIAAGGELPHRTSGTALCADLSGFTPLTEALARNLGPRRGAEELALHLNRFYDALIAPVGAYGGSEVAFSGDAITCWFDGDDGQRAIASAQAMQTAMQPFASLQLSNGESISLGVKIAIVSGPVRRFQVGDPNIQLLDTLAGAMMDRLAVLGHLARTGEILLDEPIASAAPWPIAEWRNDPLTRQRAAVLAVPIVVPAPQFPRESTRLTEEQIRPWLLPAVFARLQGGRGEFLTELRPAVALFMRFDGLNYDDEQVGSQLDKVICAVQGILAEYDGTLLQLTIGDKGSYLYAAFGAPVVHEDDVTRAVSAALALHALPDLASASIGLSRGVMRTGAYGSSTRRTYGALGDAVNLAARLMESAAPGQILASESIWQSNVDFDWQMLPALELKGKRTIVTPAALLGRRETDAFAVRNKLSALPMIGRQNELLQVEEKLALARQGHGQIVSIVAEAGMGKSRLLAEVLRHADGLACYSGECQSYGTQSAYLVWQAIWRALFGIIDVAPAQQIEVLEGALVRVNPDFVLRMPLLGPILNLSIPENGLTSGMDARLRKTSRESLLVDFLRAQAVNRPLILVLEDTHWIDPVSIDLLEGIGRVIETLPVLILLAYRPADAVAGDFLPGLTGLAYATRISLNELTVAEVGQLLAARLAYFGLDGEISPALVERVATRTQGNPFYAEELFNYLHDRALDPRLDSAWDQADLPDSLHSLILSRIDQLSEHQQITIKAASVIGRLFRAQWLYEYQPSLDADQVAEDLEVLNQLDFVVQDAPEPQLAYLFKHVITQEVAYENLAYATRTSLHEQFASYLEQVAGDDVGEFLDLLAYHYERTDNLSKKREYLHKAGEAAQNAFANESALSYLGKALALTLEDDYTERFDLLFIRKQVYNVLGNSMAQQQDIAGLSDLAEALNDNKRRAIAAISLSRYAVDSRDDYKTSILVAQEAVKLANLANADDFETQGYRVWGDALMLQGDIDEARLCYEHALLLAQKAKNNKLLANILMSLGYLDRRTAHYEHAQAHLEHALQIYRQIGDQRGEYVVLAHFAGMAHRRNDFSLAQVYYEQALHFWRSIGFRHNQGIALLSLGGLIIEQRGDYERAKLYTADALQISRELGNHLDELIAFYNFSYVSLAQNNYLEAKRFLEQALQISKEIGAKYYEGGFLSFFCRIVDELGEYALALEYHDRGIHILSKIDDRDALGQSVITLATVFYHFGRYQDAMENGQQGLSIVQEVGNELEQVRVLILLGHILREQGNLERAVDSYQQALPLALKLSLPDCYAKQAQTGLAWIAFIQGDVAEAQKSLSEILIYLEISFLSTIDEIFWIYLTCYRILQATDDPRARPTLKAAHTLLQEIAARIDDEPMRTSFLQNVRFNREIIEAWQALTNP